ncbi:MAG: ABC transporter ATP-binding protein [Burkholderiales bacterium]|nr:MAG: ABC transporter ATP-binding protein [Burkholderiales bacterium]
MSALLQVEGLHVSFDTPRGTAHAVDGVDFSLQTGETLCIVGESGCGKSVTALSIMGLVPMPPARVSGRIRFEGRDLVGLSRAELSDLRGDRLAMIFQEPMTSLNPAFTVGAQLAEVLVRHRGLDAAAARAATIEMLRRVRIPAPERRVDEYPHRMSGGMRQRVMIAMALLCAPALLIADEPTTALDVTIQAQVLQLMRGLRDETGTSIVLITHDLGVVAEMADRVVVMYAGQVVEQAPVGELFAMPQHPYTVGLMGAIPSIDAPRERLAAIDGMVPAATAMPAGCRFAARCPFADARCRDEAPPLAEVSPGHLSRCWKAPLEVLAASLPALETAS